MHKGPINNGIVQNKSYADFLFKKGPTQLEQPQREPVKLKLPASASDVSIVAGVAFMRSGRCVQMCIYAHKCVVDTCE